MDFTINYATFGQKVKRNTSNASTHITLVSHVKHVIKHTHTQTDANTNA